MFSKLATIVFTIQTVFGDIRRNTEDTRYFVGPFNGGEFPMAIDQCLPFTVLGQNFQRIECVSENEAVWTYYDDEECTNALQTQTANASTQTGAGSYFDFDCTTSKGDAFAAVEFSVGSCETETKVTMAAALDICVANTGLYVLDPENGDLSDIDSVRVYCNADIAELQYFASPNTLVGVCNDDGANANFYQVRNATTECGFMLSTAGTNVFGKLISCSPFDDDSASALSMFGLVIATILSALFM